MEICVGCIDAPASIPHHHPSPNESQVRETQTADAAKNSGEASYAHQFPLISAIPNFKGGELCLYFVKCPGMEPYVITTDVKIASYNVKGERKDYLSVGDDALPLMYMVCCVVWGNGAHSPCTLSFVTKTICDQLSITCVPHPPTPHPYSPCLSCSASVQQHGPSSSCVQAPLPTPSIGSCSCSLA